MSKRIIVTGATGFLGGFVLRALSDHQVFALVRSVPKQTAEHVTWIEGDMGEGEAALASLPKTYDAVIHLAQSPEYRNGADGEQGVLAVNVAGLGHLLRHASKAGATTFVSASTGSVYEPFDGPMTEASAISPTSYYGASKAAAEMLVNAYADRMNVANLRVFFLYGEGQRDMLIARLIERIRSGQNVSIPEGSDGLVFVPTHAEDTASVFVRACLEGWSGTYNVASPHAVSFRQLVSEIAQALNLELTIESNQSETPAPIVPDLSKLAEQVNVENFMTIEQGVKRAVEDGRDL